MFHIFSLYFLQVFFQFSPTFPNDKTELFPSSSVDGCLQEHREGRGRLLLEWILAVPKMRDILAARLLRQPTLYLLWQCPWNISYMTSRVCVCVSMIFSAICRLAPCFWDMGISKHKRRNATTRPVHLNSTDLFLQKQGVRRWNGAIFSCSTKASNSSTQNAQQIETGRSGKREAKKWLYKIQPLWQKIAIGTIFVIVARFGAHLALFYPNAILQREGFWQHKGLGKHNTSSVASSILTCNGLATKARLLLDIYVNHERCNGQLCLSLNDLIQKTAVHTVSLKQT